MGKTKKTICRADDLKPKQKKCLNCNNTFTPKHKRQLYCCKSCQRHHYRHTEKPRITSGIPLRGFQCKKCGHRVLIFDKDDRRTDFCSRHCEHLFHKHKRDQKHTTANNGMSGGMSLGSLIKREARDLW